MRAGVIGIGDMGSGLAKNLIAAGFETIGHDLLEHRMAAFADMGGIAATSAAEVGTTADAVFVMVMNGDQAKDVILGDGLASTLKPGSVVILSATIHAAEAGEIAAGLEGTGILMVDTPVSGGYPGAQGGTLTMMAAGSDAAMEAARPAMEAVSATIHRVGDEIGMGQTVKACLQSIFGAIFSATCEAAALAAKAGVPGQVFYDVMSTSSAASPAGNGALKNIIDREFVGTGSHIRTMHKDLTISLAMAQQLGVPLFTAATAMQLFHAGKTKFPRGRQLDHRESHGGHHRRGTAPVKLGVITDGISRDFAHALAVMDEFGLTHAELQFLWDKEVGDLDAEERQRALDLIRAHGNQVSCISRHIFAGLPMATTRPGDAEHAKHMEALKRCIDMAHQFDCKTVRIMSGRKEMILWGAHGAEQWNVAKGAWDALLPLIRACRRSRPRRGGDAGGRDRQRHHDPLRLDRAQADRRSRREGRAEGFVGIRPMPVIATRPPGLMPAICSRTAISAISTSRMCRSIRPAPIWKSGPWARANWPTASRRWPKPCAPTVMTGPSRSRVSITPATAILKPGSASASAGSGRCSGSPWPTGHRYRGVQESCMARRRASRGRLYSPTPTGPRSETPPPGRGAGAAGRNRRDLSGSAGRSA